MTNFPVSYDNEVSLFGDLADLIVTTLAAGITDADTTLTIADSEMADRLSINTELVIGGEEAFEIVRIIAKNGAVLTVTRGFGGTTAIPHSAGTTVTQDPLGLHFNRLREAVIAAQRFQGLVGLEEEKPATCEPGEVYVALDTGKVYISLSANTWSLFNRPDHGEYANLGADDHPQYHTESRKQTWHDNLTGDHLSTPTTHNHSGTGTNGAPVAKFRTGKLSDLGTPSAVGQVFFARDTGDLYFCRDGSTWERYSGAPMGTIMFYEHGCPAGWQPVSALNGKFPKGADSGKYSGLASGGSDTHSHSLPGLINHQHTISSQNVNTSTDGAHGHSYTMSGGYGSRSYPFERAGMREDVWTTPAGAHTHSVLLPAINTDSSGTASPVSEAASSLPAYHQLIACRKT